jgi:signal transduction histidine kinase
MAKLLVIEADPALAAILSDVLVAEGYEVGVVTAAPPDPDAEPQQGAIVDPAAAAREAAREAIVVGGIDAIVADLPLEGLRALRAVQRRATVEGGRAAPVVALVAPTIQPRALRPLALDVELRLPLDLALLVEAVRRVIAAGPSPVGASGPIPVDEPAPDAVQVLAGHLATISAHFPRLVTRVREMAAGTPDEELVEEALRSASRAAAKAEGFAGYLKSFAIDVADREGPTDLRRAVGLAMQIALPQAKARARIEKQLEEAPLVWCVESALVRVIVELLANAVFAIPRGAPDEHTITIATGTDARGNARLVITDDGAGIAPEVLERVFEPFYTTRRQESGVGLGLALVRDAVAGMGGEIAIESEAGEGTRVQVTLPPASARPRKSELGRA